MPPLETRSQETVIRLLKQFREEILLDYRKPPNTWTKDILDLNNNEYFGRTPKLWARCLLAYLSFYALLVLFFAICFSFFYLDLSMERPRWLAHQPSLIMMPCDAEFTRFCRITYKVKNNGSFTKYTRSITQFLKKYGNTFNDERFYECIRLALYGYAERKPCVFLKINKIIGFKPIVYEGGEEFPVDAPKELKQFVRRLHFMQRSNNIWISCETQQHHVRIEYFPETRAVNASLLSLVRKFEKSTTGELKDDRRFYAYDDLGRIIAVRFSNLPLDREFHVNCYIWAKNIHRTKSKENGPGKVVLKMKLKS